MSVLISIIIPTFNRATILAETLESVLAQTYSNWECILIDDASTDTTTAALDKYSDMDSRIQWYHRPKDRPKGANACRNYGFKKSKGDFIMFLDSDDVISPNCFEHRVNYLMPRNIDFVVYDTAGFRNNIYLDKSINQDPKVFSVDNYLLLFLSNRIPWTIMSVLWKREVVERFSFDETLKRFQDVDLHIRVLLSNEITFERMQQIDSYYRQAGDRKMNNAAFNKNAMEGLTTLIRKLTNSPLLEAKHLNALKRMIYTISRDFVYFTTPRNIEACKLFNSERQKYSFVNFKEHLIFQIMLWYVKYNCYNKRGFGFFRFRKFADAYFDEVSITIVKE